MRAARSPALLTRRCTAATVLSGWSTPPRLAGRPACSLPVSLLPAPVTPVAGPLAGAWGRDDVGRLHVLVAASLLLQHAVVCRPLWQRSRLAAKAGLPAQPDLQRGARCAAADLHRLWQVRPAGSSLRTGWCVAGARLAGSSSCGSPALSTHTSPVFQCGPSQCTHPWRRPQAERRDGWRLDTVDLKSWWLCRAARGARLQAHQAVSASWRAAGSEACPYPDVLAFLESACTKVGPLACWQPLIFAGAVP